MQSKFAIQFNFIEMTLIMIYIVVLVGLKCPCGQILRFANVCARNTKFHHKRPNSIATHSLEFKHVKLFTYSQVPNK